MTTSEFIAGNLSGDIRTLALQASRYPDVDMPYALDQISGWQTARHKLPMLSAHKDIVYPPRISMEQCSSEATAQYKCGVARAWIESVSSQNQIPLSATSMTDLTGGFGIDFMYLSKCFANSLYVERNPHLCDVACRNFSTLHMSTSRVECATAEQVLPTLPHQTMIYLDPARRDINGARTFAIADCTPNVCGLLPELIYRAFFTMIKLSPMLDWHKAIADLGGFVREVHIVSVAGECKELLLVLSSSTSQTDDIHIHLVDLPSRPSVNATEQAKTFSYSLSEESQPVDELGISSTICPSSVTDIPHYLYEPNASIMKAGCFGILQRRYPVNSISVNSHLFVSQQMLADFPGRRFAVDHVTTFNRKTLGKALSGIECANITVRNFPMSVADLRKRLKLRDGGDVYIFATTTAEGTHVLYVCHKV